MITEQEWSIIEELFTSYGDGVDELDVDVKNQIVSAYAAAKADMVADGIPEQEIVDLLSSIRENPKTLG